MLQVPLLCANLTYTGIQKFLCDFVIGHIYYVLYDIMCNLKVNYDISKMISFAWQLQLVNR